MIDGREVEVDVVAIGPGLHSILLNGRSFEAHVREVPGGVVVAIDGREYPVEIHDRRQWRGRSATALEAEGRQQIAASMPGKIVRVLVAAGEAIKVGQGIVVVEAMKMQNEVRSPKSGMVERLLVKEGQAVNAGEILAIVA